MTDKEIMEKDIKIKDWKWSEEHQNFVKNDCCQKARQSAKDEILQKIDEQVRLTKGLGIDTINVTTLKKSIEEMK